MCKFKNATSTPCGSMLLILYTFISLSCQFPVFHNHGPLSDGTCCHSYDSCTIPHNQANHYISILSLNQSHHEYGHELCMACMWQATSKTEAVFYTAPTYITLLEPQKIEIPDINPFQSNFINLQKSRAPPF